ncbi:DUF2499 domain-containing protein [Neosynechococcus sphagnicola]|uniref:DUF2499 domain-containing protein n=1 Tax=Neosynechococcus sphagnicola TaxID=1501145 RepID=UPI000AABC627
MPVPGTFFDNAPALEWLVILQATMTLVGNCTLMAAAWWLWRSTAPLRVSPSPPSTTAPSD